MTKAQRTRQYIIEKTAPVFNCLGYRGTSLTNLTEATGLTKGSLYANFRNKEDIATEAFKYSIRKVREMVKSELAPIPSYKKQLFAMLDFYMKYVFDPPVAGGCPLLNTAVEADDGDTPMRKVVTKELMGTVSFIEDLIKEGIDAGEFKKGIGTQEIAYTIFCMIEGAIMFSRVERSREPMEIIVRHCKDILNQLSE